MLYQDHKPNDVKPKGYKPNDTVLGIVKDYIPYVFNRVNEAY